MLNQIYLVTNIDELKKLGSIDEIKKIIENDIYPLKVSDSSYSELFDCISLLRDKWLDCHDIPYFVNERSKYLFCLTQVDGQKRNEYIGLNDELYDDKSKAKKWYRHIVKTLQPDINLDEITRNAFKELEDLYRVLLNSFEEE